jgi:hypothetical protein
VSITLALALTRLPSIEKGVRHLLEILEILAY